MSGRFSFVWGSHGCVCVWGLRCAVFGVAPLLLCAVRPRLLGVLGLAVCPAHLGVARFFVFFVCLGFPIEYPSCQELYSWVLGRP